MVTRVIDVALLLSPGLGLALVVVTELRSVLIFSKGIKKEMGLRLDLLKAFRVTGSSLLSSLSLSFVEVPG